MLARFKWLIAAAGFLIQYMVLPMLPGVSVYPDVVLAAVCALGLIYGPGAGMFYGCCVGVPCRKTARRTGRILWKVCR